MKLLNCVDCVAPVRLTDAWEDEHGVLHFDIHIACGREFHSERIAPVTWGLA